MTDSFKKPNPGLPLQLRKATLKEYFDGIAPDRLSWIERNRYFYDEDQRYMRFLDPGRCAGPRAWLRRG